MYPTGKIFSQSNSAPYDKTISTMMESDLIYSIMNTLSDIQEEGFVINQEHAHVTYLALRENNMEILEEGMNDFLENAKKFFNELLKRIIEFGKKVYALFRSFIGDFDKFIKDNKETLDNYRGNITIKNYYHYTIDKNTPNISLIDDIINEFNSTIHNIDDLTKDKLTIIRQSFDDKKKDEYRGTIINSEIGLDAEQFNKRSKSIFRDGDNESSELVVDHSEVMKAANEFKNVAKLLYDTKNDQDIIIKSINKMINLFSVKPILIKKENDNVLRTRKLERNENNVKTSNTVDMHYNIDRLSIINSYFDYEFNRTKFVSTYITNLYFEKVRAITEWLKQDKRIIRSALFGKDISEANVHK